MKVKNVKNCKFFFKKNAKNHDVKTFQYIQKLCSNLLSNSAGSSLAFEAGEIYNFRKILKKLLKNCKNWKTCMMTLKVKKQRNC